MCPNLRQDVASASSPGTHASSCLKSPAVVHELEEPENIDR